MDTARFAAQVWARAPLLSRREQLAAQGAREGEPAYAGAALFSLDAVDELLSRRGLRTPFLRVAKDGVVVPSARYTRPGGTGAQVADQVADDRVLGLFLDGHTVVLQGLHRVWPPIIDFAGALTTELGHPVQVNAYITPPQSRGFAAHYDTHDVFVVQVAGEKRWRIHEPVLVDPLPDQAWTDRRAEVERRAGEDPVLDTVLRPGDSLYLPRGYLHSAEALGGVACHLTVGVHPVTRHTVVQELVALLAQEPALRTSLPLGVDVADPRAVAADVAGTIEAVMAGLGRVALPEVADRLAARLVSSNRAAPVGPLAQAAALAELNLDSVLQVRPHQRSALTVAAGEVLLRLVDRTLHLPEATGKAVRTLLDGEPVRVADLPGLDADAALSLARRLMREAVVVMAPGERAEPVEPAGGFGAAR